MCEKIGASEAATARQEHQRGAVEESIPQTAPTQQKRSQHRAPTIVPATEPRGPQLRRQRGQRLQIASTIASGLRMVPSNKEAHQDIKRDRERERERDREKERERESITTCNASCAGHQIFHVRVALLVHAQDGSPEHESRQLRNKQPMGSSNRTRAPYRTHNTKRLVRPRVGASPICSRVSTARRSPEMRSGLRPNKHKLNNTKTARRTIGFHAVELVETTSDSTRASDDVPR